MVIMKRRYFYLFTEFINKCNWLRIKLNFIWIVSYEKESLRSDKNSMPYWVGTFLRLLHIVSPFVRIYVCTVQGVQKKMCFFHNSLQPLLQSSQRNVSVIFCTTYNSRVLAMESCQTFENSWKKTQRLMNTLYIRISENLFNQHAVLRLYQRWTTGWRSFPAGLIMTR